MLNHLYDVLEKIKDLPDAKQKKILNVFEKIVSEKEFEGIAENIFEIKNEVSVPTRTRKNTLERINRFTLSAKTPHEFHHKRTTHYKPILSDGELIEVRFSGLGSETDQEHYAIVWKAKRTSDPIVIIPTTSFKEESTVETEVAFNIGNIDFMGKETVVLLDQMTTISRKRIDPRQLHKTRRSLGQGKFKYATISDDQKNRILDGIRAYHLNETTIYQYLRDNEKDKLPFLNNYSVQISHLHRPFIRNVEKSNEYQLVYTLYEDPENFYTIYRVPCTEKPYQRTQLLNDWVNAVAESSKDPVTGVVTITKSRHDVQQEAYNKIQQSLILSSPVPKILTTQ